MNSVLNQHFLYTQMNFIFEKKCERNSVKNKEVGKCEGCNSWSCCHNWTDIKSRQEEIAAHRRWIISVSYLSIVFWTLGPAKDTERRLLPISLLHLSYLCSKATHTSTRHCKYTGHDIATSVVGAVHGTDQASSVIAKMQEGEDWYA